MIVNIASDNRVIDETFNALKLSAVAQKISTKAAVTTEQPKIVPETPAAGKQLFYPPPPPTIKNFRGYLAKKISNWPN